MLYFDSVRSLPRMPAMDLLASWLRDPKTLEIIKRHEDAVVVPAVEEGKVYGPDDYLEDDYWEFVVPIKAAPPTPAKIPNAHEPGPGDVELLWDLHGHLADRVTYETACNYLGKSRRWVEKLVKRGDLKTLGKGLEKRITTASLIEYRPPNQPA